MQTATTTCGYYNPTHADGTPAIDTISAFQFASSTCVTINDVSTSTASTTVVFDRGTSAEDPLIIQDSGSLTWGLALMIFFLAYMAFGSFFRDKKH